MKRFFNNPGAALVIALLAVVTFAGSANAQATFDLWGAPATTNTDTFLTNSNSGGSGSSASTCPYGGSCSGGSGGGQSQLDQSRQQANQCQAQSGGLGGMMQQAGSLANVLTQGLQKTLGQTVENLIQDKVPGIIQSQIQNRLPTLIQSGLQQRLPSAVSSQINQMSARGMSQASIKAALPTIIPQLVQQLITQLVREKVPQVIEEGLQRELPANVATEINSQIPEIINESNIPDQVLNIATSTISELGQYEGRVKNIDDYSAEVVNGITTEAQNGIASSPDLQNFSDKLASIISSEVAPQLIASLLPQFTSAFSGGASSGLGRTVDTTVGNLLGSNYDIMGGLSGDFFQPISQNLTASFGTIGKNLGTSLANGSLSVASPPPAAVTAAMSADDGASLAGMGSSGASQAQNSSSQIAGAAGAKTNSFAGLGNGLASATTGALGSGIGGLVAGVPYVGGFLAPIAQEFTTGLLNGVLGITTPGAGLPTMDIGTQQTIGMGFQQSDKINSQTAGNTDAIKRDAAEQTKIQKDLCAKQNATLNEAKALTDQFYKHGPDAREKSYVTYFQIWKAARKMFATMFQVSPGTIGATGGSNTGTDNGQPAVADLTKNKSNSAAEAAEKARVLAQEKNSGNIYGDDVSRGQALVDARKSSPKQFKSDLTKAKVAALQDPTQLENMPSYVFYDDLEKWVDPSNNFDGAWLLMNDAKLAQESAARDNAQAQYIANNGWNDKRVCVDMRDTVPPGGNAQIPDSSTFNNKTNTLGQWCWKWQIQTQGSTMKAISDKLATLYFDFLSGVHNVREDFITQFATQPLTDVQNLSQAPQNQQQTPGANPCPGTDPCPGTGWQASASIGNALSTGASQGFDNLGGGVSNYLNGAIDSGLSSGGSSSGGSSNGGSSFNLGAVADILGGLQGLEVVAPESLAQISLTQSTADIAGSKKETTITWQTSNAVACFAGNSWISGDLASNKVDKNKNDAVSESGNIVVTYSTSAKFSKSYTLICYNNKAYPSSQTITVKNNE
jgi:hypothetical protein